MNPSEAFRVDERQLHDLKKLVAGGEGLHVEFKRKASHPDKIVREIIAFANTEGGTLLVGVGDDGSIPGVRYPEEETLAIRQSLERHCRPSICLTEYILPISKKKFVVRLDIPHAPGRPHYFGDGTAPKESFVRVGDRSLRASREMLEILRRRSRARNIRFTYGDAEKLLMTYLEQHGSISLDKFRMIARLSRFIAARKLVLLVLANVLLVQPTEKGDIYSRAGY